MQNQHIFPFAIAPKAISEWLDTLNPTNPVQSSSHIYSILKELIKSPNENINSLEIILTAITPITIQLSLDLEALFCASNQSIDAKKRKIARLSINSLRYLALLYGQLSTHNDKNINTNINRCLQICELCFTQSTLIYDRPSTELWKLTGQMYQLACNNNCINTVSNESIDFFNKHNTIYVSIKKILIFNLCNPYLLGQREIIRLNQFLEQHLEKISLSTTHSATYLHAWDYTASYGVQSYSNNQVPLNVLFLDCHLIVPLLLANDLQRIADKISIPQVSILALKQSRPVQKSIGFSFPIVVDIIEHQPSSTINKTSIHYLSINDKLELQPFDYDQKKIKKIAADDIWQRKKEVSLIENGIVKSSTQLELLLIELQSFAGKANELIVIFDNQRLPQLGIIREVSVVNNEKHRYQLLVEKISTTAKVVSIEIKEKKRKALICPSKSGTLLIVAPEKFVTAESIQIVNKTYQLSRLLENTPSFMMYQIQADV